MPSSKDNTQSPAEQLSQQFDSNAVDTALVASIGDKESTGLINSWTRLGDRLRDLRTEPAGELAERVKAQIVATSTQLAPAQQTPNKPHYAGRSIALLATSCAVMVVAATIVAFQANTNSSATATAFRALNPQSWEVVVVTVPDERMNFVTERLRDAVDQRGLKIHSLNEGNDPSSESLEVLMASSESSVTFLEALNEDATDVQTEWNPERIGEIEREELLERFSASMQTPSRSDQHFGEVFVVLPKDRTVRVESLSSPNEVESADNRIASQESPTPEIDDPAKPVDTLDTQVARLLDRRTTRPVLVIFRRQSALLKDLQGRLDGQETLHIRA